MTMLNSGSQKSREHVPVLGAEVLQGLAPKDGKTYVDATFGRGGYSDLILNAAMCNVIGIDRDPAAVAVGRDFEKRFGARFKIVQGAFGDLAELLQSNAVKTVDGIAFDLGVSSPQLETAERGFSFRLDGPLDMRMSDMGDTAADLVNNTPEKELADIIYLYGEERASRRIAKAIVDQRKTQKFSRTTELAELISKIVPKRDEIHPATKTFQALRIAVNDELGQLEQGLAAAEQMLAPEGRLAVVTFHSLEDRIVKNFLRERAGRMPSGSRHRPDHGVTVKPTFDLLSTKAIAPSDEEIRFNPRARSAKLRVAIRTHEACYAA